MEEISLEAFQKKIFLAPFPFSDLSFEKVRPVLIISNDSYNLDSSDVIVCAISSKLGRANSIELVSKDLSKGILFKKSLIKYDSIFKIDKTLLLKAIGVLSDDKFTLVKSRVIALF